MYFSVELNDEKYYNGNYYCSTNELQTGTNVKTLPPNENERLWFAYKYEDDEWVEDKDKLKELELQIEKEIKNDEIYEQLDGIKMQLNNLDVKTMKFVDGALTKEEYEPFRLQKAELRKKYNELESLL